MMTAAVILSGLWLLAIICFVVWLYRAPILPANFNEEDWE